MLFVATMARSITALTLPGRDWYAASFSMSSLRNPIKSLCSLISIACYNARKGTHRKGNR